jgi:hypothetical protein
MMSAVKSIPFVVLLGLIVGGGSIAAEIDDDATGRWTRSIFPFAEKNPCVKPYRQVAASPPLQGTTRGDEGYPWRLMYGYCVAQFKRTLLHQDWVVSYLDAREVGDTPGGTGVSLGTDFGLQWHHDGNRSLSPYYELGGGLQYAAGTAFPAHGSRWMFTINAGAGLLVQLTPAVELNMAARYLHISNAGLLPENAGYDAFHLVIGARW